MPHAASNRPCVQSDSGLPRQRARHLARNGVTPLRRDLGQRPHDKQALARTRMRKYELLPDTHQAAMGDQVKIENARRIDRWAPAAELTFYPVKRVKGLSRRQERLDKGQTVEIVRIGWIGPRFGPPP